MSGGGESSGTSYTQLDPTIQKILRTVQPGMEAEIKAALPLIPEVFQYRPQVVPGMTQQEQWLLGDIMNNVNRQGQTAMGANALANLQNTIGGLDAAGLNQAQLGSLGTIGGIMGNLQANGLSRIQGGQQAGLMDLVGGLQGGLTQGQLQALQGMQGLTGELMGTGGLTDKQQDASNAYANMLAQNAGPIGDSPLWQQFEEQKLPQILQGANISGLGQGAQAEAVTNAAANQAMQIAGMQQAAQSQAASGLAGLGGQGLQQLEGLMQGSAGLSGQGLGQQANLANQISGMSGTGLQQIQGLAGQQASLAGSGYGTLESLLGQYMAGGQQGLQNLQSTMQQASLPRTLQAQQEEAYYNELGRLDQIIQNAIGAPFGALASSTSKNVSQSSQSK